MRGLLSRTWSSVLILCAFVMIASFENCGAPNQEGISSQPFQAPAEISISGTVQKSNLDGCQYLISVVDSSTGETKEYIPQKMDPSLLSTGNLVKVTGTLALNEVSGCMAGPIIQVSEAALVSN